MTQGVSSRSELKRKQLEAEMEAGRRAVALYEKLEKIELGTKKLKEAFPTLLLSTVMNKPYTHVTMSIRRVKFAPMSSRFVFDGYSKDEIILEDPIDGYPSDYLVTQLALVS